MRKFFIVAALFISVGAHANQVIVKNNNPNSSLRVFDHADRVYLNLSENKKISVQLCLTDSTDCQLVGSEYSIEEYQGAVDRLEVEVGTDGFLTGGVLGSMPLVMCLFARAKCAKFYSKFRNPVLKDAALVSTVNGGLVGGAAGFGVDYTITHLTTEGEVVSQHQDLAHVFDNLEKGLVSEIEVEDVLDFVAALSFMQLEIYKEKGQYGAH